jgi:hypothetical protein
MKNTITLILALMVSVAGFSQLISTIFVLHTDSNADEFYWQLEGNGPNDMGDVIYSSTDLVDNFANVVSLQLPSGNYCIRMIDDGCDGMQTGSFTVSNWWYMNVPVNFDCQGLWCFGMTAYEVCTNEEACTSDLNGDGIVSVADLLIFISKYGTICE